MQTLTRVNTRRYVCSSIQVSTAAVCSTSDAAVSKDRFSQHYYRLAVARNPLLLWELEWHATIGV